MIATASLVGAIVGVGVFGVPYAVSRAGVVLGLAFFVVLGAVQFFQHLFYAEAAAATDEQVRFVGFTEKFVGRRFRPLATVISLGGSWCALVAYVLVGGSFLHALLGGWLGGGVFAYQLAWAAAGAVILMFGLNLVSEISFVGTVGKVAALAVVLAFCAFRLKAGNMTVTVSDPLLPYGVILFSLSGLSIIPEMEEMVGGDRCLFRRAVAWGSLISLTLTVLFGFLVFGVTGAATTSDAIGGLQAVFGGFMPVLAAAFGFLAVATSFMAIGIDLKNTFVYDLRFRPAAAWLATIGVPCAFLLFGVRDFLPVVGFSGAVFGGAGALLVGAMYVRIRKQRLLGEHALGVPTWVAYAVSAVLGLGILIELGSTAVRLVS